MIKYCQKPNYIVEYPGCYQVIGPEMQPECSWEKVRICKIFKCSQHFRIHFAFQCAVRFMREYASPQNLFGIYSASLKAYFMI